MGEGQGEGVKEMKTKLTPLAKGLRKSSTDAERVLWRHLRNKQIEGCKFRRQQPMENYILDFVCLEKGLVIEVDGGQHSTNKAKDEQRDDWLKENGFLVLRYWNTDVLFNIEGVLEDIRNHCLHSPNS